MNYARPPVARQQSTSLSSIGSKDKKTSRLATAEESSSCCVDLPFAGWPTDPGNASSIENGGCNTDLKSTVPVRPKMLKLLRSRAPGSPKSTPPTDTLLAGPRHGGVGHENRRAPPHDSQSAIRLGDPATIGPSDTTMSEAADTAETVPRNERLLVEHRDVAAAAAGGGRTMMSNPDEMIMMRRQRHSTQRQSFRRVRRQRSEETLETFTEVSGDDHTFESSIAQLQIDEIEDSSLIEQLHCEDSKPESQPTPTVVERPVQDNPTEEAASRKKSSKHAIGNVSITVNINHQGDKAGDPLQIGNITVNLNFGRSNRSAGAYTINTSNRKNSRPPIMKKNRNETTLAGKTSERPTAVVDIDDDDNDNQSIGKNNSDFTAGRALNVTIQLNQDDNSLDDNTSMRSFFSGDASVTTTKKEVLNDQPENIDSLKTKVAPARANQSILAMPDRRSSTASSTMSASVSELNRRDLPVRSTGPAVQRPEVSRLPMASIPVENVMWPTLGDTSLGYQTMLPSTSCDPSLGGLTQAPMVDGTETVEAYETAVSMQNIGLHNRYGFMVDDQEVRRSSTRRRRTLSFNTSSCDDYQEQAQRQMRNYCEPMTKPPGQDDVTTGYAAPLTTRSLHLSAHGPGLTGPLNYSRRPPMQKSVSTRSFANRPPIQKSVSTRSFARNNRTAMYQRSSSRSITQSQTIAEDAQLVEDRPAYVVEDRPDYVIEDRPDYVPLNHRVQTRTLSRQESISKMTVSYQRRSSKSIFSSCSDDNQSVSDMGSVMSCDRDDGCNASVVSGRSARSTVSNLSTALSRTSKGFRGVGKKLLKPLSLMQRHRSDEGSLCTAAINTTTTKALATRSSPSFLTKMLAKRGTSKLDVEPWRALASDSPSYWADGSHHAKTINNNKKTFDVAAGAASNGGSRRMDRRASM